MTVGNAYERQRSVSRFWAHVDKAGPVPESCPDLGPCWVWTGSRNGSGYGRWASPVWPGDTYAHRVAYRMEVGQIPAGQEIDHRCFNRACVNPAHLQVASLADNRRSHDPRRLRSECAQGHAMDEANTYVNPKTGRRGCRECMRIATRRWHDEHRDEQNAKRAERRRASSGLMRNMRNRKAS